MTAAYRALFVGDRTDSYTLLMRMLEGSDIVIDNVVVPADVVASVAQRAPDLIVFAFDLEARALAEICRALRANPVTSTVPLLALARSSRSRRGSACCVYWPGRSI